MDKLAGLLTLGLSAGGVIGFWWWTFRQAKKTRSRLKINILLMIFMSMLMFFGLMWLFSHLFGIGEIFGAG